MRARDAQLCFVEGLQPTQFGFGDEDAMVKHQSGGQIITVRLTACASHIM